MSQGFVCVYYRSKGWQAEVYNQDTQATWMACLQIMLTTLRFNNPDAQIMVLDLHDQIDEGTQESIASFAARVSSAELKGIPFAYDTYNKLLALRWSPFRETALIDLDFVVTGSMEDVFDLTDEKLGVLHYPNYRRTANGVNSGLIVIKERSVLDQLDEQRRQTEAGALDETIIDRAISTGRVRATLLPDTYGKSKQLWWASAPEELTASCASQWSGPLAVDWDANPPAFRLDDEVVHAWHFSSAKERMATDALVKRYLASIRSHASRVDPAVRDRT